MRKADGAPRPSTDHTDYIVYEQDTMPDDQMRIISHVLGHMVLGHQGIPIADSDVIWLLFPDLDPGMVAAMLAQPFTSTVYSQAEELEAETFASLLLKRIQDTA